MILDKIFGWFKKDKKIDDEHADMISAILEQAKHWETPVINHDGNSLSIDIKNKSNGTRLVLTLNKETKKVELNGLDITGLVMNSKLLEMFSNLGNMDKMESLLK